MANKMSIGIGVKLDDIATTQSNLQAELNKISKNLSLNLGTIKIEDLNKTTEQIKQQLKKLNDTTKVTPTLDTTIAKQSLNEYANLVKNKIKEIEGQTSKISSIKISTDGNGSILGANATVGIDNADKKVLKFNQDLKLVRNTFTENDAKEKAMFDRQNEYLDKAISKLNQYKQVINTSNNGSISNKNQTTSEINNQINKINELKNANTLLGNAEKTRINESINGLKSETSALTQHQHGFSSMLSMMTQYAGVGAIVYGAMNQLKQGLSDINNIDDALRNLKRVSDDVSNTTLNNFVGKANEMGISLGRTTEDALTATATFKQLGYSFEEASKYMANNSLILSNVGDMSASDSASSLVSILKGFRLEAQDTTKVVDILNETGNKFAITTGDLTEGLRIGGASLALANNDLAQSTALITTGTEILRDSNMVANGLKNISMRIRGVKDDEGELVPKMREDLQNIANVDIKDVNGGFKSTYEIIKSLGERWNDTKNPLTDLQKAGLAEEVAGKQRANVFASLMQNYKQLEKVYETAGNSAGSAQKEQNAYMDSISGKLNTFKETVKATWISLTDTNGIKSILTVSADVVGGLNNVIKTIGAMPTIIMGVVGAMTLFNSKFKENLNIIGGSLIPGYSKLSNSLSNLRTELDVSAKKQAENISIMKTFAMAYQQGGVSTKGMATELVGMETKLLATRLGMIATTVATVAMEAVMSLGLSLAITGIITGLGSLGSYLFSTGDKMADCSEQAKKLSDSLKLETDSKGLLEQYEKLNKSLEEGNKTEQEKKNINDQIETVKKDLINLDSGYGDILKGHNKTYEEQLVLLKNIYQQKQKDNAKDLDKSMDSQGKAESVVNGYMFDEGLNKEVALYKKIQDAMNNVSADGKVTYNGLTVSSSTAQETLDKLKTSIQGSYVEIEKYNSNVQELEDANYKSGRSAISLNDDVKGLAKEFANSTETQKVNSNQTEANANKTKVLAEANKELQSSNNGLSSDAIKKITEVYPEVAGSADKAKAKVNEFNNALKDAHTKEIKDATDSYEKSAESIAKAQGFLDKLNKAQAVTPTIASEVLKVYPELATQLGSVSSLQDALNNKIKEQQVSQSEAYLTMMQDDKTFYSDKIKNNNDFKSAYENFLNAFNADGEQAYSIDYGKYTTYAELKQGVQSDLGKKVENWLVSFVGDSAKGYADDFANFKDIATAKANVLAKLNEEIKKINANLAGAEGRQLDLQLAENDPLTQYGHGKYSQENVTEWSTKNKTEIENYKSKLGELNGAVKEIDTTFDNFGASMKGFSGGDLGGNTDLSGTGGGSEKKGKSDAEKEAEKALKEAEEWKKKIDELKSDVKDIDMYQDANNAITQLDNTMTALKTSEEGLTGVDLANAKKKEIDVMNQQIDAQKRLQSLQELEKGNIENTLSQYGILTDSTGNLSNAYEVLAQKRQEAESMVGSSEPEFEAKKKTLQQVKDLNDLIIKHGELVNSTIPKTIDKWEQLTNTIKKNNDEIKKANEELVNSTGDKLVTALKKEYENQKTSALTKLKKSYTDDINDIEEKVSELQAKLDELNSDDNDNATKLAKLKAERTLWQKELESGNNVFAKSKVNSLDSSISDLEKTITKSGLQSQIDILNKQKSNREDDYNDEVQSVQDKYEKLEDEHKLYNKAEELLTNKNTKKIKELLSSQDESFKTIGTKLGEALNDPIQTEVENTITAIDRLIEKANELNDTKIKSSSNSSSSSSKKTTTNSNGSKTTNNGDGTTITTSADGKIKETSGKYSDGTNYTIVARYANGGRTGDLGTDGKFVIADSNEMITNADDTKKFDEMYNYIQTSGALLTQLSQSYSNIGSYTMPTLGTDLNSIANSVTNNSNTDNSVTQPVQMSVSIVNKNGAEAVMNEKSLEKMMTKVIQKSATKYGGKGFANR